MRTSRYVLLVGFLALAFPAIAQRSYDVDILTETFGFDASTTKSVELSDLHQGCPARDCIPSIDKPNYVSASDASHVADDDLVITLSYEGEYRATETLWDQIEARGIVGPMTNARLELVPVSMSRWAKWRDKHPDTLVLSLDTGFDYDYTKDRFAEYRDSTRLFMPVSATDERINTI